MSKNEKHRIPDKGEVGIDFPQKFYHGTFGPNAQFVAEAENDGLMIKLLSSADEREAQIHLHNGLLAGIFHSWAASLKNEPPMSEEHKERLLEALQELERAVH